MSLIPVKPITRPRPILARKLRWKIRTPETEPLVLVFLVNILEASVVFGVDPPVVVVFVPDPDLEPAILKSL